MQKREMIVAGLAMALILGTAGCGQGIEDAGSQEVENFTYSDMAMGTLVSESIYTSGEDVTAEIMALMKQIEDDYISWRVETSDIAAMNAAEAGVVEISEKTAEYLEQTLQLAKDSDGALDPTIGKVTRLWDIDGENPQVPEEKELQGLLAEVGYGKISINGTEVTLEPGSSVDLGAVGKGIGADEAKDFLEEHPEVEGAVISVGGSILTYGSKPDGTEWKVGITDPKDDAAFLGALSLEGEHYVSTSGDYEKYFEEDGIRYHHILDPSTGYPAEAGLCSVTIVADNGLVSDGLSTACFVLGLEKSLPVLEKYEAEAIFVDQDKQVYVTDGLKEAFELTQDGYSFM